MNHLLTVILLSLCVLASAVPNSICNMGINRITQVNYQEKMNLVKNVTYWDKPIPCHSAGQIARMFDSFTIDRKNNLAYTASFCLEQPEVVVTITELNPVSLRNVVTTLTPISSLYFDESSGQLFSQVKTWDFKFLLYSLNPETLQPIKMVANLSSVAYPYRSGVKTEIKQSKIPLLSNSRLILYDIFNSALTLKSQEFDFALSFYKIQFRGNDEIIVFLQKNVVRNQLTVGVARFKIQQDQLVLVDHVYAPPISTDKKYGPSGVDSILIENETQLLITWIDPFYEHIGKVIYDFESKKFTEFGPWDGNFDYIKDLFECPNF